ncbi:MAG TPA: hypothetical protein G4N96_06240 [Chloroflexi bacterium]|nr:hypothetical protein [Chloroflexota bacterium]
MDHKPYPELRFEDNPAYMSAMMKAIEGIENGVAIKAFEDALCARRGWKTIWKFAILTGQRTAKPP